MTLFVPYISFTISNINKINNFMFARKNNYRRNYNYSHPLAGKTYNNSHFVTQCKSYFDSDLKLSTNAS